jgi:hypothetical protein
MGTEATKWTAERALDPYLYAAGMAPIALSAVLEALGIPISVLAWITANPEAAKGLASGEMVAVPRVLNSAHVRAYFGRHSSEFSPGLHGQWDDLLQVITTSPPAPSGKAQGET